MREKVNYIGNIGGSTELSNKFSQNGLDNVYARALDLLGNPIIVQILKSTPKEIAEAIKNMVEEKNPSVTIDYVDGFTN